MHVQTTDETLRKPRGGYVQVSALRVGLAWWCYSEGLASIRAVRVLLALHELGIRRAAYAWAEKKRGRRPEFTPHFSTKELGEFIGLPEKKARVALKELLDLGLVSEFSEERITFATSVDDTTLSPSQRSEFWEWFAALTMRKRVPVPRRILAVACESSSPARIALILGACLRCIYLHPKEGGFTYSGRLSSAWVSDHFKICLRAVKGAKSGLVALDWLQPQGRISRFGELITINPEWHRIAATLEAQSDNARSHEDGREGGGESPVQGPKSAPLPAALGPKSARPSRRESSFGTDKYQRESPVETPGISGPGVFQTAQGEKHQGPPRDADLPPPRLSSIKPELDFKDLGRALELFRQAVKCHLMPNDSEHSRLLWVAAIERARTVPVRNPAGVLLFIVKNKKWDFLTDAQYEAANRRVRAHLHETRTISPSLLIPTRNLFSAPADTRPSPAPPLALSRDALIIKTARNLIAQRGLRVVDLLPHLRREDASWNRPRLETAEAELSTPRDFASAR